MHVQARLNYSLDVLSNNLEFSQTNDFQCNSNQTRIRDSLTTDREKEKEFVKVEISFFILFEEDLFRFFNGNRSEKTSADK